MTTKTLRRRVAPIMLIALFLGGTMAESAGAVDYMKFAYRLDATTHLKKLNQTTTVPPGTFKGTINETTGALLGTIVLPPATIELKLAGIVSLVTATVRIVPTKKVTGKLKFDVFPFHITATSVFNILITKAYAGPLSTVNLVGNTCKTSKPVSVTMSGPVTLGAASTFSGIFTIPPLVTCGVATAALNQVIPGPGNTFTAVASPM